MISKLVFLIVAASFATASPIETQVLKEVKAIHRGYSKVELDQLFIPDEVPAHAKVRNVVENSNGYLQFELYWNKESKMNRAYGNAMVRAFTPVAIAKTPILPGVPLNSENIEFKETEVGRLGTLQYFSEWKGLLGLESSTYIRPGSIVALSMSQRPYLVQRGQKVELIHRKENLKISVQVNALENGRLSDWIRVENPSTHKTLLAKVVSQEEVTLK